MREGIDPVAAKKARAINLSDVPTFREAAMAAHDEQKVGWRNAKHAAQWISTLEAYAFPQIGETRVDEVDGPAIRDLLADIWLTKPETARRVRQRIGTVLDWAYAKGFRSSEAPMRSVTKGLPRQPKKNGHFAAMPWCEVPALIGALRKRETVGRLALRFLILTAARSGEVRGATWSEIDIEAGLWSIPAERMKAGKPHVAPLAPPAIAILTQIKSAAGSNPDHHIFPGTKNKTMSDMTLTKVLRDAGQAHVTVHGFRSAFRDWAAECSDTPREVVEVALAHANPNKVEAAYRRTNYLEKRRDLMRQWADFLHNARV